LVRTKESTRERERASEREQARQRVTEREKARESARALAHARESEIHAPIYNSSSKSIRKCRAETPNTREIRCVSLQPCPSCVAALWQFGTPHITHCREAKQLAHSQFDHAPPPLSGPQHPSSAGGVCCSPSIIRNAKHDEMPTCQKKIEIYHFAPNLPFSVRACIILSGYWIELFYYYIYDKLWNAFCICF